MSKKHPAVILHKVDSVSSDGNPQSVCHQGLLWHSAAQVMIHAMVPYVDMHLITHDMFHLEKRGTRHEADSVAMLIHIYTEKGINRSSVVEREYLSML